MINNQLLREIEEGVISSRRQLYKRVGRSKKLLQWLNDNNILVPQKWDAGRVKAELLQLKNKLGRLPKACDNEALTARAQKYYGTWNNALREIFGVVNQRWHNHLSNDQLIELVKQHVITNQRLPLREEFDGKSPAYPYFEVYLNRFNIKIWSEIYTIVDLTGIKYFPHKKHGTGYIYMHQGVVYLSKQEYLIGKYLVKNNIKFKKEVPYGNCKYIFDFYLPELDLYIEYYGLATEEYKKKIENKRLHYGVRSVLEIFKHENTIKKLNSKVQRL